MIRGLYTAASGMVTAMRRLSVVTNDLANAQTTGYKQERTATTTFAQQLVFEEAARANSGERGPLGLSNVAEEPELDLSQGSLEASGRTLDLALEGTGLFVVQTPNGTRYTRDGSFTRDAQGNLVTNDGAAVMGEGGPIQLPDGELSISPDGTIAVDGAPFARLRLVEFGLDQPLRRIGKNLLEPKDGGEPALAVATNVRQGFLEASNVDLTGAQTSMLELQRAYEANQRMIQYQDDMMARAVNDIARPVS